MTGPKIPELLMTMTMVDLLTSRTWSTSEFWSSEFRILVMWIRNALSSHRIYLHIDFYYHFGSLWGNSSLEIASEVTYGLWFELSDLNYVYMLLAPPLSISCSCFRRTGNSAAHRQKHANLKWEPDIYFVMVDHGRPLVDFSLKTRLLKPGHDHGH